MKVIARHLREYLSETDRGILFLVSVMLGVAVFLNYSTGIDRSISREEDFFTRLCLRYLLNLLAFGIPYFMYVFTGAVKKLNITFICFILAAPLIFSIKMSLRGPLLPLTGSFWQQVSYWPLLLLITLALLMITQLVFRSRTIFFHATGKKFSFTPYLVLLLLMVPILAGAAFQDQFREVYPKFLQTDGFHSGSPPHLLQIFIFEMSYGTDFITIEIFFRGFVVLGFIKWAGREAILPMAAFYCVIHFGKPPLECISSFFGGIILGVIVYHSRSIVGGLIIHLGIAWLMELAGYLAHIS